MARKRSRRSSHRRLKRSKRWWHRSRERWLRKAQPRVRPRQARVAHFFKVSPSETIVVHDDLDLPFGRTKLGVDGGHGGHNGLRSIIADHGSASFARVRVGIGRPADGRDPADYVLSDFTRSERK